MEDVTVNWLICLPDRAAPCCVSIVSFCASEALYGIFRSMPLPGRCPAWKAALCATMVLPSATVSPCGPAIWMTVCRPLVTFQPGGTPTEAL